MTQSDKPSTTGLSSTGLSSTTVGDGVSVTVPAGAITAGKVSGREIADPAGAPAETTSLSQTYDIELSGGKIISSVSLTFSLPTTMSGNVYPVLTYYDTSTRAWTPVASTFDSSAHTVTASTPHLSLWHLWGVDKNSVLGHLGSGLKSFFGAKSDTPAPSCKTSVSLASVGVAISASSGDLVKWCSAIDNGHPYAEIVNNRGIPMSVTYPAGWSQSWIGDRGEVETAAVDGLASFLNTSPKGEKDLDFAPGESIRIDATKNTRGTINIQPDIGSWALAGVLYGADTFAQTLDGLPWVAKSSSSKTAKAVSAMFSIKDCVTEVDAIAQDDSADGAGATIQLFKDMANWTTGCLRDTWKAAYGLAGAVGALVVQVLSWLVDGVKLALAAVDDLIDQFRYIGGFNINVTQTPPTSTGKWTDTSLVMSATSLGAVNTGMSLDEADIAGGITLTPAEDGYGGATLPTGYDDLYYSGDSINGVQCLGATRDGSKQMISTPEGFKLGDTLKNFLALYGKRAVLMPAHETTQGDPGNPYYAVSEPGGKLFFYFSNGVVGGFQNSPAGTKSYACTF